MQIIELRDLQDEEIQMEVELDEQKLLPMAGSTAHEEGREENDFIDAEFYEDIEESHKVDYSVAAACGMLTASLDILWVGKNSLKDMAVSGKYDANDFVINIAKKLGYKLPRKNNDVLQGAIQYLENRYKAPGDLAENIFGGGKQHHFRDFTHHPTLIGLMFSLFAQFSCIVCGTDASGRFIAKRIDPSEYFIGSDVPEKLLFGTLHWAVHLISDMAGSSNNPGEGTGIPHPWQR